MDLWYFYERKMEIETDQGEADQDEQLPLGLRWLQESLAFDENKIMLFRHWQLTKGDSDRFIATNDQTSVPF